MEKIIIIGCPGAGKSTFARNLRDILDLPLYYLDKIWHKPDKTTISKEEFDKKLMEILKENRWIIDGNYQRTLEMRLKECDTVFLLDYPIDICVSGAASRVGTKREDLPWLEREFDEDFKEWIINFPKVKLPEIYEMLSKYKGNKNIIIFKTREESDKYLEELKNRRNEIGNK